MYTNDYTLLINQERESLDQVISKRMTSQEIWDYQRVTRFALLMRSILDPNEKYAAPIIINKVIEVAHVGIVGWMTTCLSYIKKLHEHGYLNETKVDQYEIKDTMRNTSQLIETEYSMSDKLIEGYPKLELKQLKKMIQKTDRPEPSEKQVNQAMELFNPYIEKWKKKMEKIMSSPLNTQLIVNTINEGFDYAGHKRPIIIFTDSPMANLIALKALLNNGMYHIKTFDRGSINLSKIKEKFQPNIPTSDPIIEIIRKQGTENYLNTDYNSFAEFFSSKLYDYYWSLSEGTVFDPNYPYNEGTPDYYPDEILYSEIWNKLKQSSKIFENIDLKYEKTGLFKVMDSEINSLSPSPINDKIRSNAFFDFCIETQVVQDEDTLSKLNKIIKINQALALNTQAVYDKNSNQQYRFISSFPTKASTDEEGRWHNTEDYAVEFADGWKAYFIHGAYFSKYQFDNYILKRSFTIDDINKMCFEDLYYNRNTPAFLDSLYELYDSSPPDRFPVEKWYDDDDGRFKYYDDYF